MNNKERQNRTVKITIHLPMSFPSCWDDKQINFHLNDSSWCASNLISELDKYDDKHGCICNICKLEVK